MTKYGSRLHPSTSFDVNGNSIRWMRDSPGVPAVPVLTAAVGTEEVRADGTAAVTAAEGEEY